MTSDLGERAGGATTAELRTAAALRWQRPLLTSELAGYACHRAVAEGDDLRWLQASGWLLDGYAAGGDGRDVGTAVLAGVTGTGRSDPAVPAVPGSPPGVGVLALPEAGRLRVELAAVAQADGELETAHTLLDGLADDGPGEEPGLLRLGRLAVEVRCALAGWGGSDLERLRDSVEECAAGLSGEASAFAGLVVGSVHRARGEHARAVDSALDGLAQLGWTPDRPEAQPLSAHLAAALLSQWLTALLDGRRAPADAVRAASAQRAVTEAGRQGVLLRLTLARAAGGRADHASRALAEAAEGAEAADVPALVAACRIAQSELHENAGRYREALEAMRVATTADHLDRARGRRFRRAVGAVLPLGRPGPGRRPRPAPRTETSSALETARPSTGVRPEATESPRAPALTGIGPLAVTGGDGAAGADGLDSVARADGAGRPTDADPVPARRRRNGSSEEARTPETTARGNRSVIDPADPLGVSALVAGPQAGGTRTEPSEDSGVTGPDPDSGGSPLGDALLAELNGSRRAPAVVADPAERDAAAGPDPVVAPEPAGAGSSAPDIADRSIEVDLVDAAGAAVPAAVVSAHLGDIALRSRRLVPPSGTVVTSGAVVRITLTDADLVTVLLWARSLAAHLADRVPRGGLPEGARIRLQTTGPGDTAEEILRDLAGPDETPPAVGAAGASTGRRRAPEPDTAGAPPAGPPAAGPAMSVTSAPLTVSGDAADGRAGRRRAADDAAPAALAGGLTVRPGSGGRRRAGAARTDVAAEGAAPPAPAELPRRARGDRRRGPVRPASELFAPGGADPASTAAPSSAGSATSGGTGSDTSTGAGAGTGFDIGTGMGPDAGTGFGDLGSGAGTGTGFGSGSGAGDGVGADAGARADADADTGANAGAGTGAGAGVGVGTDIGPDAGTGTGAGIGWGPGPVTPAGDPDTADGGTDQRLADAVRAHLVLPTDGPSGNPTAHERAGMPVAWSTVSENGGPVDLPKRNGPRRDTSGPAPAAPANGAWTVRTSGAAEPPRTATPDGGDPPVRGTGDPAGWDGGGAPVGDGAGAIPGDHGAAPERAADAAPADEGRSGPDGGSASAPEPTPSDDAAATSTDPRHIPEDMGLAELLAGALAAYREI